MPSAPLVSTSQSRKRQKTHHQVEKSLFSHENKENHDSEIVKDILPPALKTHNSAPVKNEDTALPALPFPATPANRITLDDLVGNTEDAFNRPTIATTPNDCVTWQHGPRSSDPASSYHTTQRSRKRARSSSPSSSQLEKSNHFSAQKDTLSMDSLQRSLKTPQNDPSIDLWARYAGGNVSKCTRQDSAISSFAHLLPSSPQTPSTTDSKGKSMRRVASCGTEWPTTETKKRKTPPKSHTRVKDIFAASKKRMFSPELPKSGRVSLLLEKIQESLCTKPPDEVEEDAEGPSSSSPIPDGNIDQETVQNAPEPEPELPPPPPVCKTENNAVTSQAVLKQHGPVSELLLQDASSSDYGGDEIDYDFMEQVEFAATQANVNAVKIQKTPSKPEKRPLKHAAAVERRTSEHSAAPSAHRQQISKFQPTSSEPALPEKVTSLHKIATVKVPNDSSDDEFGLSDPDFAEELTDLAAKYEPKDQRCTLIQQPESVCAQDAAVKQKVAAMQPASLDEFDDPYDDDVWKDIANGSIDPQINDSVGSTSQVCGLR